MNPLRILIQIRMKEGRPKGWRNRDIKRLAELSRLMWRDFSRRYNVKWKENMIVEG